MGDVDYPLKIVLIDEDVSAEDQTIAKFGEHAQGSKCVERAKDIFRQTTVSQS